jgi:hypothetical protein
VEADRADQHAGELTMAASADHQELGVPGVVEHGRRDLALEHDGDDLW